MDELPQLSTSIFIIYPHFVILPVSIATLQGYANMSKHFLFHPANYLMEKCDYCEILLPSGEDGERKVVGDTGFEPVTSTM